MDLDSKDWGSVSSCIRAQNNFFNFCSREKRNFSSMPSRRRDRPMIDPTVEREMRKLGARLDAMETAQRCTVNVGDVSEAESENEARNEGEEVAVDERLFRAVARIGVREKMEIPMYEGNLDVE
jgi:hypothetical protein